MTKLAESLRSTLAKQALITLRELFETVSKQQLDQDLESALQSLLKKSIDSNIFMAEEAERTLSSLCRNGSE